MLEGEDLEIGDKAEVALVGGEDGEVEMEGGGTDEEVGEGDFETCGCSFSTNTTGERSDLNSEWVNGDISVKTLEEGGSPGSSTWITLPVEFLKKLDPADGRKSKIAISCDPLNIKDQLSRIQVLAFCLNHGRTIQNNA